MKDKEKIIKKINGTMSQEDLPLTKEIIKKIYKCLEDNNIQEELNKSIKKHRRGK